MPILSARARRIFAKPFFQVSARLTGLRVRAKGLRPAGPGTLYVANHASYLDIPVLASLIDGQFVAKTEVKGWPLFGFLASIANTIYVSRRAARMAQERITIASRLAGGQAVILFPEGSSSDGGRVLPFRPGLLSSARVDPDLDVLIQPVSVVYGPARPGRPALRQNERDRYAWYGDMDMLPHLLELFAARGCIDVEVRFHAPKRASAFSDPRALAHWAEDTVAGGLTLALGALAPVSHRPAADQDLPELDTETVDSLPEAVVA